MVRWLCLFAMLAGSGLSSVHAASIEKLLMPGPVIEGHAKYEEKCNSCHESFSKKEQRRLCLDCHKEAAEDVKQRKGLHGRRAADPKLECKTCHSEHKGRGADIVLLVPESFDHTATDFKLEGRHSSTRCASCHQADKKYREAPGTCIDCHRKQDAHDGSLGEKCGDCHKTGGWKKDAHYDHDKTKFPLHNKHKEVACAVCHPDGRYKDTPKACIACHRINDVHGGRLGTECEKCHSDKEWKENKFDHDRKTKFPLRLRHRDLPCRDCHKSVDGKDKPPRDCNGCHAADDVHKGRNGEACGDCHKEKSWKEAKFDHLRESGYALRGGHEKVSCRACHSGPVHEVALERACKTCHEKDDTHKGQLGTNCERCHNEQGWGKNVAFDHDITRFPLIGLHATAPCEACHVTAGYRDTKRECNDCHAKDDSHKGALGETCGQCHTPNSWKLWRFNHDKDTKFALDGTHKNLACNACHREGTEAKLNQACGSCHIDDDVHRGTFGRACNRCHVTTKFDDLRLLDPALRPDKKTEKKGK